MKLVYDDTLVTPTGKWCIRGGELYIECRFPLLSFTPNRFLYEGYLCELNECGK